MGKVLTRGAEEYLSWLAVEKGRSANTLAGYRRDIANWEAWAIEQGFDPLAADTNAVEAHLDVLRSLGRHPSSLARTTSALRGLFRFLVAEGHVLSDPTEEVRSPSIPRRLPKALDEADVIRLIESIDGREAVDLRDRALVEILYASGARISEVVGLSLSDLEQDDGMLRVFGKGAKERLVPLGNPAIQALNEWLGPSGRPRLVPGQFARRSDAEAVFLGRRGARLSRQAAWAAIQERAQGVGLGDVVSPHVLRHSCASHLLAHGADIRVVQEVLGHASIATTQLYTRLGQEHLRDAYQQAHPRAAGVPRVPGG